MKGSTFNKMIETYINHLTSGSMFYSNLIKDCMVPDQLEKVPIAIQEQFKRYVEVFDNMKIYDRIYLETKDVINIEQEILEELKDTKTQELKALKQSVENLNKNINILKSLLESTR